MASGWFRRCERRENTGVRHLHSTGLTIAFLAAAVAYGSGPIIILTAIPMLVIANAYRRLNMWNANCGASFE